MYPRSCRQALLAAALLFPALFPAALRAQPAAASTRIDDAGATRRAHTPPKGFKALKDYVVRELELRPGDVVVDIGAGDGFWTELMAREVGPTGTIHAGEVAPAKVDTMAKKFAAVPQVRPYLCPTDSPGLPSASCDLAFISETYHHFDQGTQVAYLQGLRSTLKSHGRLVILERYTETGIGHGEHGTPLSRLVQEAERARWVPVRYTMIPGTYHYLAIFVNQDLFPAEQPRQDARAKKKAPAGKE